MHRIINVDDLAAISLFTGIVLVEGEDISRMQYILEKLEGRPVYTHEMPDIADKHKDELAEMVRDIYKRAKEADDFIKCWEKYKENTFANNVSYGLYGMSNNDINYLTCDSCLVKNGEFCNKYCKVKEKE